MRLNPLFVSLLGICPLVRAGGPCFSATTHDAKASYETCCTGRDSGTETINGVEFEYMCEKYSHGNDKGPLAAHSARDCATLCADDDRCIASTWYSDGNECYYVMWGTPQPIKDRHSAGYLFLLKKEKTEPPPVDDCDEKIKAAVAAANSNCETDKTAIRAECTKEKAEQQRICDAEKLQLQKDKEKAEGENVKCQRDMNELRNELNGKLGECQKKKKELAEQIANGAKCRDGQWVSIPPAQGHKQFVNTVAFSPNSKLLASGDIQGIIKLWDMESQGSLSELRGDPGSVTSLAFSPDGSKMVSGNTQRKVTVWEVAKDEYKSYEAHNGDVVSVAFSSDGQRFASGSRDNTVRLWDVAKGTSQLVGSHTGAVWGLSFSPDGKTLASGSWDTTIKLWDVAAQTPMLVKTLTGHTGAVRKIAFSPDGKSLASGSNDRTVQLWDIAKGTSRRSFSAHTNTVNDVAFSPDGKQLASASYDNSVRIWSLTQDDVVVTGTERFNAVAFSPNGKYFASGSDDGSVRLWQKV